MEQIRKEGFFTAHRGNELFYQSWRVKKSDADKIVVVTHGISEHSEAYSHFAKGMLSKNLDIYAWDLRGHGRSEGKRGVVASFDDYVEDLEIFVKYLKATYPNKKIFLLGHSMGGLVVTKAVLLRPNLPVDGLVLSSPLMGIKMDVSPVKDFAARALVRFLPSMTLFNEIKFEDLSHDSEIVSTYSKDPLRHDQICPRLYLDFLSSFEYIFEQNVNWKFPVLMQLAGNDKVVSTDASIKFFEELDHFEDRQKIVYDGLYHEIYNEVDREKVFGDLTKWLSSR
ncbi:MAG: lysophospholipase [Bdellovibrionales bacterium]